MTIYSLQLGPQRSLYPWLFLIGFLIGCAAGKAVCDAYSGRQSDNYINAIEARRQEVRRELESALR